MEWKNVSCQILKKLIKLWSFYTATVMRTCRAVLHPTRLRTTVTIAIAGLMRTDQDCVSEISLTNDVIRDS